MADSWLGRLELRFLNWWACRILILNPGMVEEAKAAGVSPALLGWMPNPVDTDQFQPCTPEQRSRIRRDLNIAEDARLIVFVGRLGPEKEIPSLIGALRQVVKQQPHARLALIGDGPLREELARLVQEADVGENVIFTGRLTTSEVVRWLQAGDIFTLVSSLEGLPCSLIEAMAVGMAAVASNIPAHTQLIGDRENGLLTEVRGEESIAKALLGLMDDPGLRASMGAAARRCALERFSTPIVVDCYEKLFAECSRQ
jgi:glycosyltransferase involved in cell wall biosynthesis